jgi:tetratricopeptide (TPR) repeat protein
VYVIYEQACIAAMDCGRADLQEVYHAALLAKFGEESVRVGIVRGMVLESKGEFAAATKLYEELATKDAGNKAIVKRQVAVLVGQGKFKEAISKLTVATKLEETKALREKEQPVEGKSVLERYQCDTESWMELASLYLKTTDLASAQFCYEELILSNPYNHLFHQRNAECLYTLGDMEMSFKYFAKAAQLNPESSRALYGLLLAAEKLQSKRKGDTKAGEYAEQVSAQASGDLPAMTRARVLSLPPSLPPSLSLSLSCSLALSLCNNPRNEQCVVMPYPVHTPPPSTL